MARVMTFARTPALAAAVLLLATAAIGPAATQEGPQPAVAFDDQRTSGRIVLVDAVRLPEGGFVAVHDPSTVSDGGLGELLGVSVLLGPGQHSDVPVTLQRNVTESEELIAALYKDANDNQAFDGGHDHGHDHAGEDPTYKDGDTPIGDRAQVEPYEVETNEASSVNPLALGAALALISVLAWALRRP